MALQNHKSFQKIFLLLRPILTVCEVPVLPCYLTIASGRVFRTCCLWQDFLYVSLEGNTATHIIPPPRCPPQQLSAEVHGCGCHVQTCIFFPCKPHAQVLALIVTCWILFFEWTIRNDTERTINAFYSNRTLFISLPYRGHCPLQCWEQQAVSDTYSLILNYWCQWEIYCWLNFIQDLVFGTDFLPQLRIPECYLPRLD